MENAVAFAPEVDKTVIAPLQFTMNDGQPVVAKVKIEGAGNDIGFSGVSR